MPKKPNRWKPVKDQVYKWESPGQTIVGVYRDVQERTFNNRTVNLYTFVDENDRPIRFWGSAVLDRHLALVPQGSWVQIEFKGQGGHGARRYKNFDINVAEGTEFLPAPPQEPTD